MDEIEEWRSVEDYPNYEVSSLGRVRNVRTGRVLKNGYFKNGYVKITLTNGKPRTFTMHSLVAHAFIGPRPEGLVVAHWDGTRDNNVPSNLRYTTNAANQDDRNRHGTMQRDATHHQTKLTSAEVRAIHAMAAEGIRRADIADHFGTSRTNVSDILNGKSRTILVNEDGTEEALNIPEVTRQRLTEDQVREIRFRYAMGGVSQAALASEYGVGQTAISKIALRKVWSDID